MLPEMLGATRDAADSGIVGARLNRRLEFESYLTESLIFKGQNDPSCNQSERHITTLFVNRSIVQ